MIVPKPEENCRIKVGGQTAHWREGEGIFFDDTFPHEVWNDTGGLRVVLLMDVVRPLRFPISLHNAFIIRLIAASPFIQDAARNYEQWERRVSAIWDK
jgi:ornithine lipid ester-linked acyl 2-hydroxylase